MDIKLINLQRNKLAKVSKYSEEDKNKYLSDFLYLGLGLKIVKENLHLTESIKDNIDYLCIDESYRLVIVEKREGKFSRTIKSGLMYIDYINENISKIKMILVDSLGADVAKNVSFDTRLVLLTEYFNSYDYSAIRCLLYNIEAINYTFLDTNLIFVKEYQNHNVNYKNVKVNLNNQVYKELEDFLLSLGDEVNIWGNGNVITVRKIKAIAYIIFMEDIVVLIGDKQYAIKANKDLEKVKVKLEKAYDEN